jgi:dTDP-4-dehydrorhamnose 3,5-epimerase
MIKVETEIFGAFIIEPDVFTDHRGIFFEAYNREKFLALGIADDFQQDNFSASKQGVLRGLHFQFPPKPMAKLVRCGRGRLFDVAVDMRQDSPTFKKWFGIELTAENKKMFYVPVGCAHGFYALEDCELLYKCSNVFQKDLDGGFSWQDPEINVVWPLIGEPIVSERDAVLPSFSEVVSRVNEKL